jgi:hypothetical protein
MVEVGKVYVELVHVTSALSIARHWKVLYKVSEDLCFVTNEEGRYEIKNLSMYKEGYPLAYRDELINRILNR